LNPRPSGYEPNDIEAPKSLFHHPLGSKGHTNLYIYFNDIRVRGFILTGAPKDHRNQYFPMATVDQPAFTVLTSRARARNH
jgi:hypothetical protein